jgi:uncharacterized protein (DUF1800 family)
MRIASKFGAVALGVLLGASTAHAQDETPAPDAAQQRAAKAFVGKGVPRAAKKPVPTKPAVLTPLNPRERVVQLLDRFTFGPRPGEVDRVLAQGEEAWVEQQLNPDAIKDDALNRRLGAYLTINMQPAQALEVYPDRPQVTAVADGKAPMPTDPLRAAVFEVEIAKLNKERDQKKPDASGQVKPEPSDEEKAAQKKADQAEASRIFGELIAMPKAQRMDAVIKMPVEDRIVLTANGNLPGDQRNLLINDFNPKERAAFYAMSGQVSSSYNIGRELGEARFLRDILTERQMQQVMSDFWFNHFNVYAPKDSDQWYTTSYERDVIRRHALDTFPKLLAATATSPAMMVYLDNWLSIGPDSLANGVNPANPKSKKGNKGLNENYGREVMELHTVGVNGGYSQADVTALAAILTGWGVDNVQKGSGFLFDPKRHEPGPKVWLGYVIDDHGKAHKLGPNEKYASTFGQGMPLEEVATADSMKQGITALNILAMSPQTAHFISTKLAQYFVADNPPPALVDRLTATYLQSGGDIKTMLRAIITSPEFNSRQYFHNKVKTPEEFLASAFRTSATDPQNPGALVNTVRTMGMPLYNALPPTGYYLTADQWMNTTALVDRLNFAYQLTNGKYSNQKFDAPNVLAMGLLTPSSAEEFGHVGAVKPVGRVAPASDAAPLAAAPKLMGVAAKADGTATDNVTSKPAAAGPVLPLSLGVKVAMHVLEATMIGSPVSPQTNQLIEQQLVAEPAAASPADTLNLLTALVMGSPDFQLR